MLRAGKRQQLRTLLDPQVNNVLMAVAQAIDRLHHLKHSKMAAPVLQAMFKLLKPATVPS